MWAALDILIGLATCYALMSLFCSVVQEFIAQAINSRGKLLVESLKSVGLATVIPCMLPDLVTNPGGLQKGLKFWRWGNPAVETQAARNFLADDQAAKNAVAAAAAPQTGLKPNLPPASSVGQARLPHDVPADVFVRALLEKVELLTGGKISDGFEAKVKAARLPRALTQRLLSLSATARTDVDTVSREITAWYDGFMAQVEHWYTRRAQAVSLIIALIAAAAFNVDTIRIGKELYASRALSDQTVELAKSISDAGTVKHCVVTDPSRLDSATPPPTQQGTATATAPANAGQQAKATEGGAAAKPEKPKPDPAACMAQIEKVFPIPLGWDRNPLREIGGDFDWDRFWPVVLSLIGIAMSGFAISLGARFWFDTLKTVLAFRTGGQPTPATSTGGNDTKDKGTRTG